MTAWLTSRHPDAVAWMRREGIRFDRMVTHLDPAQVAPGDTVIGTLPMHAAAEVHCMLTEYRVEMKAAARVL